MAKIHLYQDDPTNDVEVWLAPDLGDFDGLCIGVGRTREDALADAESELCGTLEQLHRAAVVVTP